MSEFALTPEAADDRLSIWCYIAADKLRAADRVESAKVAACGMLAKAPLAGGVRRALAIIRILHGHRNLPVVLATEPS